MCCRNHQKTVFQPRKFKREAKIGLMSCITQLLCCFFCSSLSLKYWKQLSACCLNILNDKLQNNFSLAAMLLPHFDHMHLGRSIFQSREMGSCEQHVNAAWHAGHTNNNAENSADCIHVSCSIKHKAALAHLLNTSVTDTSLCLATLLSQ